MIFVILDIITGVIFSFLAVFYDNNIKDNWARQIVKMTMLGGLISFLTALDIVLGFYVNAQLTQIIGVVVLFCYAFFVVRFSVFCFQFPGRKTKFYHNIYTILLLVFAVWLLIAQRNEIVISSETGFEFYGKETGLGTITWSTIFNAFYIFVVPLLAMLSMFMRLDSIKNKIQRQQVFVFALALVTFLVLWQLLQLASVYIQPMFNTLFPIALLVFIMIIYQATKSTLLYDFKYVMEMILRVTYSYVLPALAIGLALMLLYPLREANPTLFAIFFLLSITAIILVSYYFTKFLNKRLRHHEIDYATTLESDLAKLNYEGTSTEISEQLAKILAQNLDSTTFDILIELEENVLCTVYSTHDKNSRIRLDSPFFDTILNANHPVVLRSQLAKSHALSSVRKDIIKVLDANYADAMIVIKEGRKVIGVIFLGPKKFGNAYTDYDYNVFQDLYSYFFVVGYYLKNIANESVVGTVNRELSMSGQIIQSIQENIDRIDNPKVDVGYLSKSAHSLGGEFVDFIRLTDERYIMVLGDLSGKGINASMSMVILKSIVRTFLGETRDFKVLVQKVNEFIRYNLPRGTFFAGLFCLMDFADNTVYYINCGVPALFMYNQAYNNVIEIQGEGRVLGFVKSVEKLVHVKRVKLNPGDMLLACTDGLVDSTSLRNEPFGKARISQAVIENLNYPAQKITQFLFDELLKFTSKEQEDDVTIIGIKCLAK